MWYHNLDPKSIIGFKNLYEKLITHFSIRILPKKVFTELFIITQRDKKFITKCLKRVNKEILKLEGSLEIMAIKALINGVYKSSI